METTPVEGLANGRAETPSAGPPRMASGETTHRRLNVWRIARITLSAGSLLGAWWFASLLYANYILPSPATVWDSFVSALSRGLWTQEMGVTLFHMFAAVALILVIGLPIGILIGRSVIAEDLSRVWLIFLQTVPTIVLIALALIFIGTNSTAVIAVTVASGLTYFMLSVIQGTRAIDHDLIEMASAYGAKETVIMRSIVLPSVIPYFLAGSRITLGVAWQVTLFAEYLMGSNGVGFQISTDIKLLDTADVFMWGLSIVALTLLFEYGVFRPMEACLLRHTRRA